MLPGETLEQYVNRLVAEAPLSMSLSRAFPTSLPAWQAELKTQLLQLLGLSPEQRPSVEAEVKGEEEAAGYLRRYLYLHRSDGVTIPAYLLLPGADNAAESRCPGLLAVHGHGMGKVVVAGVKKDWRGRDVPQNPDDDYGVQGALRGYVTLIPDQVGFGELMFEEDLRGDAGSSCMQLSMRLLAAGHTTIGQRVLEAMVCLDYLSSLPQVDATRLAIMGLSGGGTTALFTGAIDDRLWATVVCGYLCTFRASILAMAHCVCNYVPHILDFMEMYDIAALTAPRLLYIISGIHDPIFPMPGVEEAMRYLRRVYEAYGAPENLGRYDGPEGHRFYSAEVWDWLAERL